MGFRNRAIEACRRDWSAGIVDESNVRSVLQCRRCDIKCLEGFIGFEYPSEVRLASARVLASAGDFKKIIEVSLLEQDKTMLCELIGIIGGKGDGVEALYGLLESQDTILRDSVIDMFRRTGKSDQLVSLLFGSDEKLIKRIKRYINEQGQNR